jgi:hypothetical protein
MKTLYSNTAISCFLGKHFAREVGPNGVRPRASAATPYVFGCGAAAQCILFLTMTWAVLTHEAVLCPLPWEEGVPRPAFSPAGAGRAYARRRVIDAQGAQPATARRRVRGRSGAASQKANLPKQLPNNRQRSIPGNALNLHKPGSDKSGGVAKSRFVRIETVNNILAVGTPSGIRPTVPLLDSVHHRTPNPAVVGGSPSSHGGNTVAINGTRMNRKP